MEQTAQFTLDAVLEDAAKAVTETQDGDLIIEGVMSDIGIDREGEAFEPGAFQKAIDNFLAGQASLLYHHQNDQQLGYVTDLTPLPDKTMFKAVVPKPPESSPLLHAYNLIKRGMMKAVSPRGLFKKRGNRIYEADIAEISVTPFPVNPRALFEVAQKAFDDNDCGCGEPTTTATDAEVRAWFDERFTFVDEQFEALGAKAAEASQRRRWAKQGIALPDGSFPITKCGQGSYSVGAAKQRLASGNADAERIKRHIRKRAKALGCPDQATFD